MAIPNLKLQFRPQRVQQSNGSWSRSINIPTSGKFVTESHYVTSADAFASKYPSNAREGIDAHMLRSLALYKKFDPSADLDDLYSAGYEKVWTPSEGGNIGQGSIGNSQLTLLKPESELWLMNMMWAAGNKPDPETKYLLSANGRNVVVSAGYETGPGSAKYLGGVTPEVHHWLGTNNDSIIHIEFLADQTTPVGPVELDQSELRYTVTAQSLNVRAEAKINSEVLGYLPRGYRLLDAEKVTEDGRTWMRASLPSGTAGWVSLKYLDLLVPMGLSEVENSTGSFEVTSETLNVRKDPSITASVIGSLKQGEQIPEGEKRQEGERVWMKVSLSTGQEGWASTRYLQQINTSAGGTPEPVALVRVTSETLNVRKDPSITASVIGSLKQGEQIPEGEKRQEGERVWMKVSLSTGQEGWASTRYLEMVGGNNPINYGSGPRWLAIAESEKGVREAPGNANHPRILEYLRTTNTTDSLSSQDQTDWCSAFVNWCIEQAGYEGTNSVSARSWNNWGQSLATPRKGCIAVFWRERRDGWKGHVGFWMGENSTSIQLLGGNQSNRVCLAEQPKRTLLSYRWPKGLT
jgi:uncharacterized protein (TIGR02594 family)